MAEHEIAESRANVLHREIVELTVLHNELSSLKPNRSVYTQQGSGDVCFKADHAHTLSHVKCLLDDRVKELNELQKKERESTPK